MLTITYRYRTYPSAIQEQILLEWMDICRGAYSYALREIKDWCDSRKCLVDRCSLEKEFPTGFVIKQVRILRKADKWYASISLQCDVSVPDPIPHGHPFGVDIGLSKFLAIGDGTIVLLPKFFKSLQSQLKLLQRRLSRKKKRSNNYEKARLEVARIRHQIVNTRIDFHYKQAHALCDIGDTIFMEDLDYTRLAKRMFGKQMLDAAFGQFRTIVKYVCWKRGKFFAKVDARGTSQECPKCEGEVKKDLSVRVHQCQNCNYITDRDVAAGQNIRNRGVALISTAGLVGTETACADDLPGVETIQSRKVSQSP